MDKHAVLEACDRLSSQLKAYIQNVNQIGSTAMATGDLDAARAALDQSEALGTLAIELAALRARLDDVLREPVPAPAIRDRGRTNDTEHGARPAPVQRRTRKGVPSRRQLPQREFRIPLLQTLVEMGGRGRAGVVEERVGELLQERLTQYDYANLESGPVRWRKKTQWCRKNLIDEGLLVEGTPRGIWEISDEGRVWLAQQRSAMQSETKREHE